MALKDWRNIPEGGLVPEPGNSLEVKTGAWRSRRPIIDFDRCSHCLICWLFCPDSSFLLEGDKIAGIDYDHCKGCGICAAECPRHCIAMVAEQAVTLAAA